MLCWPVLSFTLFLVEWPPTGPSPDAPGKTQTATKACHWDPEDSVFGHGTPWANHLVSPCFSCKMV